MTSNPLEDTGGTGPWRSRSYDTSPVTQSELTAETSKTHCPVRFLLSSKRAEEVTRVSVRETGTEEEAGVRKRDRRQYQRGREGDR